MTALVEGATVGYAFGKLMGAALEMKEKVTEFKPTLEELTNTLQRIKPFIEEMKQQNTKLGRSEKELASLVKEMEAGTKLVNKCSKIHRLNICCKIRYYDKLVKLREFLERFFKIELQAQMARDVKDILIVQADTAGDVKEGLMVQFDTAKDVKETARDVKEGLILQADTAKDVKEGLIMQAHTNENLETLISMNKTLIDQFKRNNSTDSVESNPTEQVVIDMDNLLTIAEKRAGGGVVGAVIGELLKAVLVKKYKASKKFKQILTYLETTLLMVAPVIEEKEKQKGGLGLPKEELESLIRKINKGKELVDKCSKLRPPYDSIKRIPYHLRLADLVVSLVKFFKVDIQGQNAKYFEEILLKVRIIH